MPFRFDRNRFGGRAIIYLQDDIPSKQFTKQNLPDELNLRKTK